MSLINNKKSLMFATIASALVLVIFGSLTVSPQKNTSQNQTQNKFQYVVSKTEIKKGAPIKEEDVEIKDFGVNIEGTYKNTGEVVGRNATADIAQGKPIMKAFVQTTEVKKDNSGIEPSQGYRAVPVLIRQSSIPPYLKANSRFDLYTRENSMMIENLKILNILDPTKDTSNKMLVLEIKNSDVSAFIDHQVNTKGFVFLQKNPDEFGEYKFHDYEKSKKHVEVYMKTPSSGNLPSVPHIADIDIEDNTVNINTFRANKEVELIVGNKKTKMEFNN